MGIQINCDQCGGGIDTSTTNWGARNDSITCGSCYSNLESEIVDLHNEVANLAGDKGELEEVVTELEKVINELQIRYMIKE